MDARKIPDLMKTALSHYTQRQYRLAFEAYKKMYTLTSDKQLELYCKCQMLLCQYQAKTLSWWRITSRATDLSSLLANVNALSEHNKKVFEQLSLDMHQLRSSLDDKAKQTAYIYRSASFALDRVKQGTFVNFASMMEIGQGLESEADYLSGLFKELKNIGFKYISIDQLTVVAKLAESLGDCYSSMIQAKTNIEHDKKFLLFAKEHYEQALRLWRSFRSTKGEHLLSTLLHVGEDLFELGGNPLEEAKALVYIHQILAGKDLLNLPNIEPDEECKQGLIEEIKEHHAWFYNVLSSLTIEQTEHMQLLRTSLATTRPSAEPWQQILENLISASPKPSRRALGKDMYANSSTAVSSAVATSVEATPTETIRSLLGKSKKL